MAVGGFQVLPRRRSQHLVVPSTVLATHKSLKNKFEEPRARLLFQREIRNCLVICSLWFICDSPNCFLTHISPFIIWMMQICQDGCRGGYIGTDAVMKESAATYLVSTSIWEDSACPREICRCAIGSILTGCIQPGIANDSALDCLDLHCGEYNPKHWMDLRES